MSEPPVPEPGPDRFAARYRLDQQLGLGGMGEVWRAYDERLHRDCAVKVLRQLADDAAAERFSREARTLASLAHPGVVTVHDYGVDHDRPFLVMELLPGPSLAQLLRERGPLPIADVRTYGSQIAAALQACHAAGVVHRDVKPANMVLDGAGGVRLVDFGIALGGSRGIEATLTEHGAIIGSASYLAPEQATGHRADARSDVYGLGCLLMTLLTGRPPFEDDSPVTVLGQHMHDRPPRVRERRPEVPDDIDHLVDQLLAKDPAARPADAAEVARRLAGRPAGAGAAVAAEATAVMATQRQPEPTAERGGGRRALIAAAVILGLLAVLTAGAVAYALSSGGEDEPAPVPTDTSTPTPTPTPTPTSEPEPAPENSPLNPPSPLPAPELPGPEPTTSTPTPTAEPTPTVTASPTATAPESASPTTG